MSGSASTWASDRERAEDIATRVKGWRDGPELVPWLELQIAAIRGSERVRVAEWLTRKAETVGNSGPTAGLAIVLLAGKVQRGDIK